ncbi:hypothetical protein Tco_0590629 [Tanacetum coccineum]
MANGPCEVGLKESDGFVVLLQGAGCRGRRHKNSKKGGKEGCSVLLFDLVIQGKHFVDLTGMAPEVVLLYYTASPCGDIRYNLLEKSIIEMCEPNTGYNWERMNQNGNAVNDNIRGDVRNVIENDDRRGCTYKEFLACNPKEDNQKVKYSAGSFVSKALTWWRSHIHSQGREATVARLVPHLVTPENKRIERYIYGLAPQIQGMVAATEPVTIQRAVKKAGTLTDEAVRNGSLKKNLRREGGGYTRIV